MKTLNLLSQIEWFPSYAIKIDDCPVDITNQEKVYWVNVLKAKGSTIIIEEEELI